jgi:hypothetical protein
MLKASGYEVFSAASPWRLSDTDRPLIEGLAEGMAAAAREMAFPAEDVIADWLAARRKAESCVIGHMDVLGLPPLGAGAIRG